MAVTGAVGDGAVSSSSSEQGACGVRGSREWSKVWKQSQRRYETKTGYKEAEASRKKWQAICAVSLCSPEVSQGASRTGGKVMTYEESRQEGDMAAPGPPRLRETTSSLKLEFHLSVF